MELDRGIDMMLMRKRDGSATAVRRVAARGRGWLRKRRNRTLSRLEMVRLRLRNRYSHEPATGDADAMVSLTTYGRRAETVWATIESIAGGDVRPRKLVLWLDDERILAHRSAAIRRLEARGLEVRRTADLGPHKKYYPALPEVVDLGWPLITADDDVLYPRPWLRKLLQSHDRHPDDVICYRANEITVDPQGIAPYAEWPRCRTDTASPRHFATGVSGVLYPLEMTSALKRHGDGFRELSPRADDVWLHWVALREGIEVRQVDRTPRHFPIAPGSQTVALTVDNVAGGGNDRYVRSLYDSVDVQRLRLAASR